MRVAWIGLLAGVLLAHGEPALAHDPFPGRGQAQLAALFGASLLAVFWAIYVLGSRLRPPSLYPALVFHATAALCALTLFGPLDDWAKTGTAAHMAQHMLLVVVIAPLWVLSRPLPQIAAGGGQVGAWFWKPMLRLADRPLLAAHLHAAAIWFWHMPYFYKLAVDHPWWHALEHACFLITAGAFWWAVLNGGRRNAPRALLALLFTLMHTGFLGALLTFAREPLYGETRNLQDQQLAGLIMWVAAAIPYLAASAWIGHRWYRQLLRRLRA